MRLSQCQNSLFVIGSIDQTSCLGDVNMLQHRSIPSAQITAHVQTAAAKAITTSAKAQFSDQNQIYGPDGVPFLICQNYN